MSNDAFNYLKYVMQGLSNILYNTSQSDSPINSKDVILDSIKNLIQEYNDKVEAKNKIDYMDNRNKSMK